MTMQTLTARTHDGPFQADEVGALTALEMALNALGHDLKIIRSRDDAISADFLVDVGLKYDPSKGLFDHHQTGGAGRRETGEPYASFGLVWKMVGKELCGSSRAADIVDLRLVRHVDAVDCGERVFSGYSISTAINSFNPCWNRPDEDADSAFADACKFMRKILEREILRASAAVAAYHRVRKAATKSEKQGHPRSLVVMDNFIPWKGVINTHYPDARFVIYPDHSGNWVAYAVPDRNNRFACKTPFPDSWKGLSGEQLDVETGIAGGVVCHDKRFLAVHSTKEGAIAMATEAMLEAGVAPLGICRQSYMPAPLRKEEAIAST